MMFLLRVAAVVTLGLLLRQTGAIVSDETFDNCAFLGDNSLQLSWTVRRDDSEVDFQLCGCDIDRDDGMETPNEYMGFGLSGSSTATLMEGADVTIAYVDEEMGPVAVDYFLAAYSQCTLGVGVCPDAISAAGECTDDVRNVRGFRREGLQCVSFTRPFSTSDSTCDITIDPDNEQQYIVWAVGGVGETAFVHFRRATADDPPIHLGRAPELDCAGGLICPNCPPFEETVIDATGRNETFVASIGPPGNERGYQAITGRAGWGFSWYINDTLIPHIVVERGYTYTFVSQGGRPEDEQNYHPFYLTDSISGGRLSFTSDAQREAETVYAGFAEDGTPLGVGPYCLLAASATANNILNTCGSQEEFTAALTRRPCTSDEEPGSFTWTPDENTPDVVYYQCATHRSFGYKITVAGATRVVAYTTSLVLMVLLAFAL